MWLLESDIFDGRKLWLRPGKRYLFGRTASERESPHHFIIFSQPHKTKIDLLQRANWQFRTRPSPDSTSPSPSRMSPKVMAKTWVLGPA